MMNFRPVVPVIIAAEDFVSCVTNISSRGVHQK